VEEWRLVIPDLHFRSQEKMLLEVFCSHEKMLPGKFKFLSSSVAIVKF
jgi:hypothetical protein